MRCGAGDDAIIICGMNRAWTEEKVLDRADWRRQLNLRSCNYIQLRGENLDEEAFLWEAMNAKLCTTYQVPLIINDHVELQKQLPKQQECIWDKKEWRGEARGRYLDPKWFLECQRKEQLEQAVQAKRAGTWIISAWTVFKRVPRPMQKNFPCDIEEEIMPKCEHSGYAVSIGKTEYESACRQQHRRSGIVSAVLRRKILSRVSGTVETMKNRVSEENESLALTIAEVIPVESRVQADLNDDHERCIWDDAVTAWLLRNNQPKWQESWGEKFARVFEEKKTDSGGIWREYSTDAVEDRRLWFAKAVN